jgi:hypothetical protein
MSYRIHMIAPTIIDIVKKYPPFAVDEEVSLCVDGCYFYKAVVLRMTTNGPNQSRVIELQQEAEVIKDDFNKIVGARFTSFPKGEEEIFRGPGQPFGLGRVLPIGTKLSVPIYSLVARDDNIGTPSDNHDSSFIDCWKTNMRHGEHMRRRLRRQRCRVELTETYGYSLQRFMIKCIQPLLDKLDPEDRPEVVPSYDYQGGLMMRFWGREAAYEFSSLLPPDIKFEEGG